MAELLWSNIAHQVESPCPNNGQRVFELGARYDHFLRRGVGA